MLFTNPMPTLLFASNTGRWRKALNFNDLGGGHCAADNPSTPHIDNLVQMSTQRAPAYIVVPIHLN